MELLRELVPPSSLGGRARHRRFWDVLEMKINFTRHTNTNEKQKLGKFSKVSKIFIGAPCGALLDRAEALDAELLAAVQN